MQTAAIIVAVVAIIALRGVVSQYAAGVVLQSTHPFRVGDHVETHNHIGVVKELNPSVAGAIVGALNRRFAQLGIDATVVTPPPPPPFTPSPPV